MLPNGEYIEVHEQISIDDQWTLTQHKQYEAIAEPASVDSNSIERRVGLKEHIRIGLSKWMYGEQVAKPTPKDLHEIEGGDH
jgi:ubiquinol-cytochrome c reductase cytochrome b subunit